MGIRFFCIAAVIAFLAGCAESSAPEPKYIVTFILDGTDGATLTGGGSVQTLTTGSDAEEVLAVGPDSHFFVNWTLDTPGGVEYSTENPLLVTGVAADMTIVANFAIRTYLVSFTLDETDGASLTGGDAAQVVAHGSNAAEVTANPPSSHDFVNWTRDTPGGEEYSADNPLTVTDVAGDMTLVANFVIRTYTVTFALDDTSGASLIGDAVQVLTHDSDATEVTAVPPEGHVFLNWTLDEPDGEEYSTENPLTLTNVTRSISLVANFVRYYQLNFSADSTLGASVSGEASQEVAEGGSASAVEAVAPEGYEFVNWTLDVSGGEVFSTHNPLTVTDVACDMALVANFALKSYSVIFDTDATSGASLEGDAAQTVTHGGSASAVEAVPPDGGNHFFVNWTTDAPGGEEYSTDNPLTVTDVTADMTLVANFAAYTYTVTFLAASGGYLSIDGISQGDTVVEVVESGGSTSAVQALSHSGYGFDAWERDGVLYSGSNPLTINNVTEDITVTAVFQPL